MLQQVARSLLKLNVVSYSAAISACEKDKHWQEALASLHEMATKLLMLNVISYSAAPSAATWALLEEQCGRRNGSCGQDLAALHE